MTRVKKIVLFNFILAAALLCAAWQSLPNGVMFTAESNAVGTEINNTVPFDVLKIQGAATQTITTALALNVRALN